ncbi:transposable element Tc1 transposase [Trichonephila clavipes]|nr:transposable element Tc1 transposase [Trichonephila clavipes]
MKGNLRSLNGEGLSAFEKEDFPITQQELVYSGTVPQCFEFGSSGPTSTEQLEKQALNVGRIPLTANHRWLRLQWAHEHRAWQAYWYQVVFSDESRFNLWDHDGRIRVRRYAGERCLSECVIERHSGLTPEVIVWGAISYPGRSNLLRIEGNLNSNRYVHEMLQPDVVPFLQGIPGAILQQDNARPHFAKTVRDFCSTQHKQLLP